MKNTIWIMSAALAVTLTGAAQNERECPFDAGGPGSIHAFAERLLVHRDPAVLAHRRSLDLGGPDGFDARVKKLDEAMARLGVARK